MTEKQKVFAEKEARAIAEAEAEKSFTCFDREKHPLLAAECTTGKNGWIFYLRQDLQLPPESWRLASCVTRNGDQLLVLDERHIPGKMQEVADTMQTPRERFF